MHTDIHPERAGTQYRKCKCQPKHKGKEVVPQIPSFQPYIIGNIQRSRQQYNNRCRQAIFPMGNYIAACHYIVGCRSKHGHYQGLNSYPQSRAYRLPAGEPQAAQYQFGYCQKNPYRTAHYRTC